VRLHGLRGALAGFARIAMAWSTKFLLSDARCTGPEAERLSKAEAISALVDDILGPARSPHNIKPVSISSCFVELASLG